MLHPRLTIPSLFFIGLMLFSCSDQSERKIRLAENTGSNSDNVQTVSSVLQVAPEQQHVIAILRFENKTNDASLDWLSRGLADMLAAELAQSLYINIVPLHILEEKLGKLGDMLPETMSLQQGLLAAKQAGVATLVTGSFSQQQTGLTIEVNLRDVSRGRILRTESVRGESLERVFLMVNKLSEQVRQSVRADKETPAMAAINVADMTQSVAAFKCYSEALDYMDKVLYEEADVCLAKAIELDSTFASAYLKLAIVKHKLGKPESSVTLLNKARRHAEKLSEPDRIMVRLLEAEETGDVDALVTGMQDLLKFEPYDVDTRLQLANNLRKFCQYDRAVEQYETILEMDPDRAVVYSQLARLYAHRGDFHEALWYLDKYENLAEDQPGPYYDRGVVFERAGRFRDAAGQLQLALEKRPDFHNAARHLATVYAELGDLQKSLHYSDLWLENEPNSYNKAHGYTEQARTLWRFGKTERAYQSISQAYETWPTYANAALVGGALLKTLGKQEAARSLYERYISAFSTEQPENIDNYKLSNLLLFCTESLIDTESKINLLEKFAAVEKRPLQKQFYEMHLGILHMRAKSYRKANEYFAASNQGYLNLVAHFPHVGWSSAWKYTVEAIKLQPKQEHYDFSVLNDMLASAKKAGRTNLEVIAAYFLAQYHGKYGRREPLAQTYHAYGTPLEDTWRVIGPFRNQGFNHVLPPEEQIAPEATYVEGDKKLAWRAASDGAYDGYVDLRTVFDTNHWASGYAAVVINSPEKRKVQLRLATNEGGKLWLNGKRVWQMFRTEEVPLDHDIVSVVLHPGDNTVLLKVVNSFGDWGFYLRVTDENGKGMPDIEFKAVDGDAAMAKL